MLDLFLIATTINNSLAMNALIKEKIKTHFNKAVNTYDLHCGIQNEICTQAIKLLLKVKTHFNHISDFACGTGESTQKLIQNVDFQTCYAIDFSKDLLAQAKKKLDSDTRIRFVEKDMDEFLFERATFDLIFCNMGLQWSTCLDSTLALFSRYLKENGILLFSMPIEGNFPEIKAPFKLALPNQETILQWLHKNNFVLLESQIYFLSNTFEHPVELLKSLKYIGANYSKSTQTASRGLQKLSPDIFFTLSDATSLTYKMGIYLALKN